MSTRLPLVVLALLAALISPRASRAEVPRGGTACFLDRHRITLVRPYYEPQQRGRALLKHLVGAEVRLAPQLELSAEWLRESIAEQLEAARESGSRGCLGDVGRVDIRVDPNGDGISVRLLAEHPSQAEQVVRRAAALVGG
jgi:hypothetical protein